jgi:hypothetical protein
VLIGLEQRDLPAVQSFSGGSRIASSPAWRLPDSVDHWMVLPAFLSEAMRRDFNISVVQTWELGGSYFPSPGVTPEVVYPFVAEVDASQIHLGSLTFMEIDDLKNRIDSIQEGHLMITACRLLHALDAL